MTITTHTHSTHRHKRFLYDDLFFTNILLEPSFFFKKHRSWLFAVTTAPGGDTYFGATVNSFTQILTYSYYLTSLLGYPFPSKQTVTRCHMFSFVVCLLHGIFVLLHKNMVWTLPAAEIAVMLNMLAMFTNFHYEELKPHHHHAHPPTKSDDSGTTTTTTTQYTTPGAVMSSPSPTSPRLIFSFDSSGWGYVYHFGVAKYISDHVVPRYPSSKIAFSGSSGGALVAAVMCSRLDIPEIVSHVLSCQPQCRYNPWNMFPCAERAMERYIPYDAHSQCSGKLRVLLTRISGKYPFVMGEVKSEFKNREDLLIALRGSCHIPFIGGVGPYKGRYFDGFFWMSMFVPWRHYNEGDCVIKSSAIGNLTAHIRPSYPIPWWWFIFPPEIPVLQGMYEQGYADASKFFSCWTHEHHVSGEPFPGIRVNPQVAKLFEKEVSIAWAKAFALLAVVCLVLALIANVRMSGMGM
eukprot:c4322_g1_i1.p1 GENE.c4322_g1_i1~~c4322_g1_i1.p1  ORF type:complete len:463 (+),score=102.20 c4322_g1_i1:598-1986(+)